MTEPRTITFKNWYPLSFVVDADDETGETQRLPLEVRRFTKEQGKAFHIEWMRVMNPPHARAIFRQSDGDEQLKTVVSRGGRDVEVFVVGDDEIERRRIEEMTPDARAAFFAQAEADNDAEFDFLVKAITEHVRVVPGQAIAFLIEPEEGAGEPERIEVKTGADLVRVFGGQLQRLRDLGLAVWSENTLTGALKKVWRSRSASSSSSSELQRTAPGAADVPPAGSVDSVATAAVMGSSATPPSGSTGT